MSYYCSEVLGKRLILKRKGAAVLSGLGAVSWTNVDEFTQ
jgi:hypothetical protein